MVANIGMYSRLWIILEFCAWCWCALLSILCTVQCTLTVNGQWYNLKEMWKTRNAKSTFYITYFSWTSNLPFSFSSVLYIRAPIFPLEGGKIIHLMRFTKMHLILNSVWSQTVCLFNFNSCGYAEDWEHLLHQVEKIENRAEEKRIVRKLCLM
jgi:hypothetical protein